MESQSNIVKSLEYVQQKRGGGKAFFQGMIALGVFVVSLLVVIFVYLPYITSTKEISGKKVAMLAEVAALELKYNTISSFNRSELDEGLKTARYYIPDDIRVAQLATFINQNATQFDLEVSRLGINEDRAEVKQSAAETEKDKLLGSTDESKKVFLGRVEGPFSFRGTRENIYKFLDFLVMGGFATNFDQVSLSGGEKDIWSVSFFTSYYYLEPVSKVEAARPFLEVQKGALIPITKDTENVQPTPVGNLSPSSSPTPTVTQ